MSEQTAEQPKQPEPPAAPVQPEHHHQHHPASNRHVDRVKHIVRTAAADHEVREHLIALGAYTIIALVMFWYITININTSVISGGGDVFQSLWELWWTNHAIFTLHASPYFTNLLFYPVGANLVTETLMPLAGLLSLPLQWISLPFAYNIIFFLGFILAGLFTYMLAFHITKNKYGSFLAGLIFAFSPMHIAQAIGHLNWTTIEFMPLFIFLFILMIENRKRKYAIGAGIAMLLVIFAGDPEQGILMVLLGALLLLYYLFKERSVLLNKEFAINFVIMVAVLLILGLPFFIPIISGILQPSTLSTANQLSGIPNNLLYSDNLISFFLPSYYNGIFHNASASYYNATYGLTYQGLSYTPSVSERTSYIGYSVIILLLIGLYTEYKSDKRLSRILFWVIAGIIFIWLAIGPYLQVGSSVTGIPGIYLLYRMVPLFNIIREPGRFDVIVTLAFAVIAAVGFENLTKNRDQNTTFALLGIFFILIMIEYSSMPLSSAYANSLTINAQIPKGYYELGQIKGNFTTLILPILPNSNSSTPELSPGLAMYYETAIGKPILGGYTSRENATQTGSIQFIPLIVASQYLQEIGALVYPSPVLSNVTNATNIWLANYNTGFIAFSLNAYTPSQQQSMYNYLTSAYGQPLYANATTNTVIYSTNQALGHVAQAITAYSVGTWIPGYQFCGQTQCNFSFETAWWGTNGRSVIVYSPANETVNMTMHGIAYANGLPLQIYLEQNPIRTLNLTTETEIYVTPITLSRGFNTVTFYSQNLTSESGSPYINYGLQNITFTK